MKLMKVLALGVTVGGVALAMNTQKTEAAQWTPRTAQQISADIAKTNGKEYTIVWGDTLSGISQATNISVQKLADMNKIANVDLIYAGNKLVFSGNVATVQNNKGETVAQSVIKPQDKVDSTKPVGQPATSQGTT
ncbi:LysM peptidoglycan-binding domain-containing protein, partial [Enterococcus hirae]